jgi:hypothetical protein
MVVIENWNSLWAIFRDGEISPKPSRFDKRILHGSVAANTSLTLISGEQFEILFPGIHKKQLTIIAL